MRILVKYMELGLMKKFELLNMDEEVLYKAKIDNKSMHRRVTMTDAYDNPVGKSELITSSFITKSNMTDGKGEYIDEMSYRTGFHPKYISAELAWEAQGEFSKWKYEVKDEYGERVMRVSTENPKDRKYYSLDIRDGEDIKYCCHFMLTVIAMESLKMS
ncbi:MAG: hypothetical protein IJM62_02130 [Lachnospiraceae bacterium]|nr:hypothetical protein [Lachnospiraceae bacterium]